DRRRRRPRRPRRSYRSTLRGAAREHQQILTANSMRPITEIVAFIDQYVGHALERPHMYARSPDELEHTLLLLEMIRNYALGKSSDYCSNEYIDHLTENGFGALGYEYASKQELPPPTAERAEEFARFVDYYRDYLSKRDGQGSS
ncbi:MAG TPA: hypothetical protein VEQ85_03700, partial [Lacipirellulaceae bacterium]|nr:hypothetical protein [Lacipirellulaceae bacterium]